MKALVTGGAGFIGANLVEALVNKGHFVRVLDNFSTGKRENLSEFKSDIEVIEGDIRSYHNVIRAVEGINMIFHQAALPSVPRSVYDPITSNDVNTSGTLNVLVAAKERGIKRVVFASSSSIYGDNPESPKKESMIPNPLSPYAVSKMNGENYCRVFSKLYNIETVCIRYFNVFGPKQDPNSMYSAVIPKFINLIRSDIRPTIYGDGEQSRDFTYIENIVKANLLATEKDISGNVIINCACNVQISVNEIVKKINNTLNKNIDVIYEKKRVGEVKHSLADISKAKEILGYEPLIDFDEGLKLTIERNKQN